MSVMMRYSPNYNSQTPRASPKPASPAKLYTHPPRSSLKSVTTCDYTPGHAVSSRLCEILLCSFADRQRCLCLHSTQNLGSSIRRTLMLRPSHPASLASHAVRRHLWPKRIPQPATARRIPSCRSLCLLGPASYMRRSTKTDLAKPR